MTMLIGVHGKKNAGKDTLAQYLNKTYGAKRYAFADPLKDACAVIFDVERWRFDAPEAKKETIEFWGLSPREMAQQMGTEVGRVFRTDIWVRRAQREWTRFQEQVAAQEVTDDLRDGHALRKTMVISDVRFEDEVDWIEGEGGLIIHLDSAYAEGGDDHASEAGIAFRVGHVCIPNRSSFETYYEHIDTVLQRKGLL